MGIKSLIYNSVVQPQTNDNLEAEGQMAR